MNAMHPSTKNSAGTATTRDYLYLGYDDEGTWTTANAAHPHGVRKINHITAGTTTATDTLTYNADGTMQKRVEPGTTTDYTWTKLNQLASVKTTKSSGSDLTRYTYDADGSLLVRTTSQETVAYVAGMELRTTDGTNVTATRSYACGTVTAAMRTTTGNAVANGKLTYLMADTQASTQIAVDAGTGTATRRRYTPFGDQRSGTLPTGTDRWRPRQDRGRQHRTVPARSPCLRPHTGPLPQPRPPQRTVRPPEPLRVQLQPQRPDQLLRPQRPGRHPLRRLRSELRRRPTQEEQGMDQVPRRERPRRPWGHNRCRHHCTRTDLRRGQP